MGGVFGNSRQAGLRRRRVAGFRACLGLSVALATGLLFGAERAHAQSLAEELDYLIRTNPQVEAQRAILRRAQESVRTARAGFFPTVSATGSVGNELTSDPTTRPLDQDNDWLPFRALGVEVRQNLFDGQFNSNSVDSALMARDSVAFALNSTVQTVMLQGATTYLEVLRLNELIRVARASERTIRVQLELETERVERGAGIEVDVLQNKSRLQLAIEARVDLEGQLRQVVAQYIQTFDRDPDVTRMRLMPPPTQLVPPTLEEALFTAQQENPLLVSRDFLTRAARFTVEAQKSGYLPRFDAVARYDAENNVGATRDHSKTAAVLIEMSWDLFSGFLTQSNVAAAQESLIEQFAINDTTERDVERQVRQAWSKLENTRTRKDLLLNAVSIAQEVFTARQRLRENGKETALAVLDAENEVFQAEQNLIRADYDSRIATYELAAAMGVLSPGVLGIQSPIIDNEEMFFVSEGEVRDPDPIDEVEAYWDGVQSQRNPAVGASLLDERPSASPAAPASDVAPSAFPTPRVSGQDLTAPPQSLSAPEADAEPGTEEGDGSQDDFSLPLDLESRKPAEESPAVATAAATKATPTAPSATASNETQDRSLFDMIGGLFTAETVVAPESPRVASAPVAPTPKVVTPEAATFAAPESTVIAASAPEAPSSEAALPADFSDQVASWLNADRESARSAAPAFEPSAQDAQALNPPQADLVTAASAASSTELVPSAAAVPVAIIEPPADLTSTPEAEPVRASEETAPSVWPEASELGGQEDTGEGLFDVPGATLFGGDELAAGPSGVPR